VAERFEFQLQVEGPEISRKITVGAGSTIVGRQAGAELQLDQIQVSRRHAQIECTATECRITDLGSSNGTHVDGEKLTPHVPLLLTHDAVIRIGPFELTFKQIPVAVEEVAKAPEPLRPAEPARAPAPETIKQAAGPPPPAGPPLPPPSPGPSATTPVPLGLSMHSQRLLSYLPGVYHTDFMARFLGVFESILTPIEWNVDNFDVYLHASTAPPGFLPWLATWFDIAFDSTWDEAQRRAFLADAHRIYARRGTRWALSRALEIYTGHVPEIDDQDEEQEPFTFTVRLPRRARSLSRELIERIIDANKPAHTMYVLKFGP
jgi:phage tail-like protein